MNQNPLVVSEYSGEAIQKAIDSLETGGQVVLPEGKYILEQTVRIKDSIELIGSGENTLIFLADNVNENLFTNSNHSKGNKNITIKNLILNGNSANQRKPAEQKKLSFCNGVYFTKVENCCFEEIKTVSVYQTGLHFNKCKKVRIKNFYAENLGWSGFSTSGTDDIVAINSTIIDSGRDKIHSAIHLDGGNGAYVQTTVRRCTGNAIMIDSNFAPMTNVVIKGECSESKRGIHLSGSHNYQLSNILITNSTLSDNQTGMMVSNASNIFINDCLIRNSSKEAILLQGKFGGVNTVISNVNFENNATNISEIHVSHDNYFIQNNISQEAVKLPDEKKINLQRIIKNLEDENLKKDQLLSEQWETIQAMRLSNRLKTFLKKLIGR